MSVIAIGSLDDERLLPYRDLKSTNATRWRNWFIAEGEKLVRRLLESDYPVESVLAGERWGESISPLLPAGASLLTVPDAWVPQIVGFNFHRGVLACGRRKPELPLAELCRKTSPLTLTILPDVQDPENLGSILRISAALGVDGTVLGERSADPLSRRALRVSMGASLRIPIVRSKNMLADLEALRDVHGLELWAAVLDDDARPLAECVRPPRVGLMLGNEGHGLPVECAGMASRRVTIPMAAGTDSLNVATAAGIFLYKLLHETRP